MRTDKSEGEGEVVGESSVLTVDECAVLLRISRGSCYEAVRRGSVPSVRIGRRLLIPRARLLALLDGSA